MSKTKFNNIIRSALWNSYDCICFYCSRPLDWDSLHIDHVICEHIASNLEEFEEVKRDYGLQDGFDINALYNLVPSHSKCNGRKSNELFSKSTTLYYIELARNKVPKIEAEIEKIKNRRRKGQIISKLQAARETNLITTADFKKMYEEAKQNDWDAAKIKLPFKMEFIDEAYDAFYLNKDYSHLYDKQFHFYKGGGNLDMQNDKGEDLGISTLREWQNATSKGFFPKTNIDIKASSHFTHLEELMNTLKRAVMPKASFISDPWIDIDNLDLLSPNILYSWEGKEKEYAQKGVSVGEMVRQGLVKVADGGPYRISLEFDNLQTSLIEQFRADFNNDGIEDIFVRGWVNAVGGTLGYGVTGYLTRYSKNSLIESFTLNEL